MPRYAAFFSYSRKDTDMLGPLLEALKSHDHNVWFDQTHIRGGELWEEALRRGLTQSNCVLVCVTHNSLGSFVDKEIDIAIDMRKTIIPLVFDDAVDADTPTMERLRKFQFIDFRSPRGSTARTVEAVAGCQLAPVVATYNRKGGVGKTTLTMNLGAYFFKRAHKRVLLVDFDTQASLSIALVRDRIEKVRGGIFNPASTRRHEVLKQLRDDQKTVTAMLDHAHTIAGDAGTDFPLERFVHTIDKGEHQSRFDIVVGAANLDHLSGASAKATEKTFAGFARFIGQCRSAYDLILIDCGPAKDKLALCALSASTHVLSPIMPDLFGLGSLDLFDDIALETGAEAAGREQMILINHADRDPTGEVRRQISESKYGENLLSSEMKNSSHLFVAATPIVNGSLNFLAAYGTWGPNPNAARQSLQNVAKEVGKRVGIAAL